MRVLESPSENRAALMDELCRGRPELREEIEELVAAAEHAVNTTNLRAGLSGEPPPLPPGSQIGQYRIERELERGGMSIIYLAHDTVLQRAAVLKTPRFSRDPRFRTRLEQEARLAARLSGHPNIAVIYGLVQQGEDLYIAQELVEGVTLRQAIASGPMPVHQALDAGLSIASAMAAAHNAGIVHRDLKPENIMQLPNGSYKVLDFGIAKLDAAALETTLEGGLTLPGEALGTPGYASPEQLLGRPVDRRSDIFSFGIVLYELLTGEHPFGHAARYAAAVDDPQPLPSGISATIPATVPLIVERCLQKAPALRYDSAAELERDLLAAREEAGPAIPLLTPGALWWWRFHLFTAALVNALVVVALWAVREWWPVWKPHAEVPDLALLTLFFVPLALACVTGVLRFNLAFTVKRQPARIEDLYRGARKWLRTGDGLFAGLTALAGLMIAARHAGWATLLISFAVSIVTVAFVIEPNTADEAIGLVKRRTGRLTGGRPHPS
jgi:serine/threonine-protein kinase